MMEDLHNEKDKDLNFDGADADGCFDWLAWVLAFFATTLLLYCIT